VLVNIELEGRPKSMGLVDRSWVKLNLACGEARGGVLSFSGSLRLIFRPIFRLILILFQVERSLRPAGVGR
jgi:hypothetical protein